MRMKVLVPTLLLLALFCAALGATVYLNVSQTIGRLMDNQIEDALHAVESDLIQAQAEKKRMSDTVYQQIVQKYSTWEGGVFVLDSAGMLIADSAQLMAGQDMSSEEWFKKAMGSFTAEFNLVYGLTDIHAHSLVQNDHLIVAYLPQKHIAEYMDTPLYLIGVVGIIGVVLVGILIYVLITRLLINPLESFAIQAEELGEAQGRQLETKPLRFCPALAASATHINKQLRCAWQEAPEDDGEPESLELGEGTDIQSLGFSNFELTQVVRAAFEPCRQTVLDKQLAFSLFVDNSLPDLICANRGRVALRLTKVFSEVFAAAEPESQVAITLSVSASDLVIGDKYMEIAFEVVYNGTQQRVLLEAKRG